MLWYLNALNNNTIKNGIIYTYGIIYNIIYNIIMLYQYQQYINISLSHIFSKHYNIHWLILIWQAYDTTIYITLYDIFTTVLSINKYVFTYNWICIINTTTSTYHIYGMISSCLWEMPPVHHMIGVVIISWPRWWSHEQLVQQSWCFTSDVLIRINSESIC